MTKLAKKDYEYRHEKGSVSSLNYHFVFCPKRRKAVLIKDVAKRLQEIIFEVVKEHGWQLIALEIMPDHVHLFSNSHFGDRKETAKLSGSGIGDGEIEKAITFGQYSIKL